MSKRMKTMLIVYLVVFLVAGYAFLNDYNVINIEKDIAETIMVDQSEINLAYTIELDDTSFFLYTTPESGIGLSGYKCLVNTFCSPVSSDFSSLDDGQVFSTSVETNGGTYHLFYGKNDTNSLTLSYRLNDDVQQISLPQNTLYFITYVSVSESVDTSSEPSNILFE